MQHGIGREQRFEHFEAAAGFCREVFDGCDAVFECGFDGGRVVDAGGDGDVEVLAGFDGVRVEAGADDEVCARLLGGFGLGGVQHGSRADEDVRQSVAQAADGVNGGGRAESDFGDGDAVFL